MKAHKNKTGKFFWFGRLAIFFLVLLGLRLALPYTLLHYFNKKLAGLDGYQGRINDIDVELYRGAYVLHNVYIDKVDRNGQTRTEFFNCSRIDFSLEWAALFEKKLVGEVNFDKPVLKYTRNKTIGEKAEKDNIDFIQLVKDFIPLRINRFAVNRGQIHYIDQSTSPKVDLPISEISLIAKHLTNEGNQGDMLPASINLDGNLFDGKIDLDIKLDPLSKRPAFDLNGELTATNLVYFNPFFRAYADFDLKKGTMEMFTEFAAINGLFKGYVKPIIKDLDIAQFNREEGNIPQVAWEAFVGSLAEIFQNQRKEQLASKIPVKGKFNNPEIGVFEAVISILKNAFIEALKPSIDYSISTYNLKSKSKKGVFKQLFSKKTTA